MGRVFPASVDGSPRGDDGFGGRSLVAPVGPGIARGTIPGVGGPPLCCSVGAAGKSSASLPWDPRPTRTPEPGDEETRDRRCYRLRDPCRKTGRERQKESPDLECLQAAASVRWDRGQGWRAWACSKTGWCGDIRHLPEWRAVLVLESVPVWGNEARVFGFAVLFGGRSSCLPLALRIRRKW